MTQAGLSHTSRSQLTQTTVAEVTLDRHWCWAVCMHRHSNGPSNEICCQH